MWCVYTEKNDGGELVLGEENSSSLWRHHIYTQEAYRHFTKEGKSSSQYKWKMMT